MARNFESYISVFEDVDWRGTNTGSSFSLYVDSESFDSGKQIINNNNLTRSGRGNMIESQISGPIKPEGNITFTPRSDDIIQILYSHFQVVDKTGSGPYVYTYVPSKFPFAFDNNAISTEGTYGVSTQGVYSVSFLKRFFDTTEYNGTNAIFYQHGICDSLAINIEGGEDVKFECAYKFRDLVDGTAIPSEPPSATVGSFSEESPYEWYHGTVTIGGVSLALESIRLNSKNNLEEKSHLGRLSPDAFKFKEYEAEGEFTLELPPDGMEQIGSMFALKEFAIAGTLYKDANNIITFTLPHCLRTPFDVNIEPTIVASIPFKAFGSSTDAPLTIGVTAGTEFVLAGDLLDALNGARTLSEFGMKEAANGARTLSEYTMLDRKTV